MFASPTVCCALMQPLTRATRNFRIALFHPALISGGIQRVFVNLAAGFLQLGFAVDLIQATPAREFRHAVPEGVRLIDLNAKRALTSWSHLVRYCVQSGRKW